MWPSRRKSAAPRPTLLIYGRPDCHLCDVAKGAAEALQQRLDFTIEVRDIDDDPAWQAAYGEEIPVGFIGDRKIFKLRIDPVALERALRASR